ncbi:MAG: hypothetical protein V4725_00810 [Bacteroidota bacterium]|nr:hypothetical protein [Ferruginibacter sp.]
MLSFTQEDLVQYLYNESSPEKSALIKAALETDWNLREEFEVISSASNGLEKISLSPRKIAVDNILNYAEKSISALSPEV